MSINAISGTPHTVFKLQTDVWAGFIENFSKDAQPVTMSTIVVAMPNLPLLLLGKYEIVR